MQKEQKIVAAGYIVQFYNDVAMLSHNYSLYLNEMLEEAEKQKGNSLDENDRERIKQLMQSIRYNCHQVWIKYVSIAKEGSIQKSDAIEKAYKTIKESYVLKSSDLELFVIEINAVLVTNVIKSLFDNSQELVSQIYGQNVSE